MLSGPDPTEPTTFRFGYPTGSGTDRAKPKLLAGPTGEIGMSDQEDSSDAYTSSGDLDCEIVDNSSRDEEIDEQLH